MPVQPTVHCDGIFTCPANFGLTLHGSRRVNLAIVNAGASGPTLCTVANGSRATDLQRSPRKAPLPQ